MGVPQAFSWDLVDESVFCCVVDRRPFLMLSGSHNELMIDHTFVNRKDIFGKDLLFFLPVWSFQNPETVI